MSRTRVLASGLAIVALMTTDALAARRATRVTYVSGGSVYVEAGSLDGLRERDTLQVTRGDTLVARIRVAFLSLHRASCDTLQTFAQVTPGDSARFDAVELAALHETEAPSPAQAAANRPGTIRGRLALRHYQLSSDAGTLTQPALDLRLDGSALGGRPLDFVIDFRSRRSVNRLAGRADRTVLTSSLYRASITSRTRGGGARLTAGRIASPAMASASLFDGALLERRGLRLDAGLFGGTQPNPARLRPSSDVVQGGAYASWHPRPTSVARWSLTSGGATSRAHGQANRDYAFVHGWFGGHSSSASFEQELDWNRGWKRARSGHSILPTGTRADVVFRVRPGLPRVGSLPETEFYAGFDQRRSVLLWRDRETPETSFDDRFRQGARAGIGVPMGRLGRASGEFRTSSIEAKERQNGWSTGLDVARIGVLNAALRARYSLLTGAGLRNSVLSLGAGLDLADGMHMELTGGTRRSEDVVTGFADRADWTALDLDVTLGSRSYAQAGMQHDGGSAAGTQGHAGLSWRF